jgi:hypothetical protein
MATITSDGELPKPGLMTAPPHITLSDALSDDFAERLRACKIQKKRFIGVIHNQLLLERYLRSPLS